MPVKQAHDILFMFNRVYTLHPDGTLRNKFGEQAPARTIELAARAMAALA
jgi:hypothetical protein